MFIYLGEGAYGRRVYDSEDGGMEYYTEEQLKYAISVGADIKYLNPNTLQYAGKITCVERVYHPDENMLVFKLDLASGSDIVCECHMYNLTNGKATIIKNVPFAIKGCAVYISNLVCRDNKFYYQFTAQAETTVGIMTVENKGSVQEGSTTQLDMTKFVRKR